MKKITYLVMSMLVLILNIVPVSASVDSADLPHVIDDADLMSDSEEAKLDSEIEKIRTNYDFDVVLLTVESLEGYTPEALADDYYDYNGYGIGDNNDGVLFLISMEERDYYTSTTGYGIEVFTDYGIERLNEQIVEYLSDGDYYGGMREFLTTTQTYLDAANAGEPIDIGNAPKEPKNYVLRELIAILAAVVVGFIVVMIMKAQMNTAKPQKYAGSYVKQGSFKLTRESDVFLYSNVTKTRKPEPSQSGGSSTHTGSSGTSHGGGGGKF